MKNLFSILFLAFSIFSMNAQFTTSLGTYKLESGKVIQKGTKIKIASDIGKVNNEAYWVYYGKKKLPIPVKKFSNSNANQVFEVEKVVKMRGVKDETISTLVVFSDGKQKCYAHIIKAIQEKELEVL